jgi:hypothetical protein
MPQKSAKTTFLLFALIASLRESSGCLGVPSSFSPKACVWPREAANAETLLKS